ncbi:MAG TPA: YicC family protein [Candidatus Omnitrophota bacterium]|nr:YicC family protein [Candidatus Omnitrophota bacterium]HPT39775.1 YicC family protein [Candidatus Omnitrophota bacterium]
MKNKINSMTGFGCQETEVNSFGRVSVELRCTNHKFLETVFHLPEGLLSLEEKLKKEIEEKLKRGRIYCAINIRGQMAQGIFVNRKLLKNYLHELNSLKKEFKINDGITLDSLIRLPGILSLKEDKPTGAHIWEQLKPVFTQALTSLLLARQKEGCALAGLLKKRSGLLKKDLIFIKKRFVVAVENKLKKIQAEEERLAFLKGADVAEETDRLHFHINNFQQKIDQGGAVGKELDFITQEMQREANTLAAKSFDLIISGRAVEMKSQIEKIREQVQNIE